LAIVHHVTVTPAGFILLRSKVTHANDAKLKEQGVKEADDDEEGGRLSASSARSSARNSSVPQDQTVIGSGGNRGQKVIDVQVEYKDVVGWNLQVTCYFLHNNTNSPFNALLTLLYGC
jgi:hypothetical protein